MIRLYRAELARLEAAGKTGGIMRGLALAICAAALGLGLGFTGMMLLGKLILLLPLPLTLLICLVAHQAEADTDDTQAHRLYLSLALTSFLLCGPAGILFGATGDVAHVLLVLGLAALGVFIVRWVNS